MEYIKPERIWLKEHPDYSEKWVQDRIAEDPSILGLGELVLRDKERPQLYAGRLDLLLQDPETEERYEVEVQLGASDESHIIRTLEYWDIERKRYPRYDHTAVIVAEDITSRFLNVLSLLNGTVPLVAIQLQAMRYGEFISLVATKVLDRVDRGLEGEEEDVREITDRSYWEQKAPEYLRLSDEIVKEVRNLDSQMELKYNKFYIGIAKRGGFFNLCTFNPHKKFTTMRIGLPQSSEFDTQLEESGLDVSYEKRGNRYKIKLNAEQYHANTNLLNELLGAAYHHQST